jgi:hypothetical protein
LRQSSIGHRTVATRITESLELGPPACFSFLSYRRKPVSIAEMLGWTAPNGIECARL